MCCMAVPIVKGASQWVAVGHNRAMLPAHITSDAFSSHIEGSLSSFSASVLGYIPFVFDAALIDFTTDDPSSMIMVKVSGEDETAFLSGCFYNKRDIMNVGVDVEQGRSQVFRRTLFDKFTGFTYTNVQRGIYLGAADGVGTTAGDCLRRVSLSLNCARQEILGRGMAGLVT